MTTENGSSEQHDNHCWITFHGINWFITWKDGDSIGVISFPKGMCVEAVINTSQMDWDAYNAACEAMNRTMMQ
jgi:hypothetical protein